MLTWTRECKSSAYDYRIGESVVEVPSLNKKESQSAPFKSLEATADRCHILVLANHFGPGLPADRSVVVGTSILTAAVIFLRRVPECHFFVAAVISRLPAIEMWCMC